MASTFQYWTGAAWTTETYLIRITVNDTLYYPMALTATVANPEGARETTYSDYQRVRILENDTSQVLFYGKIERIKPFFDAAYGQVIELFARDNLQELLKREINRDYTGLTLRSALIAQMISNYSYSGNIDTSDAAKFVPSPVPEPGGQLNRNYTGSGKSVLKAITDLANADPWTAAPTGFGHDFYLDTTFVGNNPTPYLHYFIRGSRPTGGAAANGLTVRFGATESNQVRAMLVDYGFPTEPRESITIVRVEYVTTAGDARSLSIILLDISNVVGGPYTTGETITGNLSATTAIVEYYGTTFLCVSNWSGNFTAGETLTGGSSGATSTFTSSLRQTIQQDAEYSLRDYSISNIGDARDKAAQILRHSGSSIVRGNFNILRWPHFTIGPTTSLVRVGQVIRVDVNPPISIDQDMLVTQIIYDEGPGINNAKMEVLGTSRGIKAPPHIFETFDDKLEVSLWQSVGATGGVPTGLQLVNLTNVFTAVDDNDISWGAGTATYSDGSTQTINAGALNLANPGIYYLYIISGNAVIQNSQSFSTVVGINNSLVAIAQRNSISTQLANIVSMNSGSPTLVAGTIIANQLSAITANMGLLTAGEIRVGSGTPGVDYTGFRIFSDYIAGYAANVLQAYIRASDGKFLAGAGNVTIDSNGIVLTGDNGGAGWIIWRRGGQPDVYAYLDASGHLEYHSVTPATHDFITNFRYLRPLSDGQSLGSPTVDWNAYLDQVVLQGSVKDISPDVVNTGTIGGLNYLSAATLEQLNAQEIRRRSGAGGSIGTDTAYFENIYVSQINLRNIRRIKNWATQITVGAAGGAAALPALPAGYALIEIGGIDYVVPYYAAA